MERAFEESEVFELVKALDGDKAPDGFSLAFFHTYWEVLKEDIKNVFYDSMVEVSVKEVSMQPLLPLFLRKQGL